MWPLLLLRDKLALFHLGPSGPHQSRFHQKALCILESESIKPNHNFPILRQSVTDGPSPPSLMRKVSCFCGCCWLWTSKVSSPKPADKTAWKSDGLNNSITLTHCALPPSNIKPLVSGASDPVVVFFATTCAFFFPTHTVFQSITALSL